VRVFSKILEKCADVGNKVLTVHSRRAGAEVVDMIGSSYPGRIILHWYSGSRKVLERAVSYGFYFSINTSMISSAKGREIVNQIPRDRLLTESDGPFVKTNGRAARPSDMVRVIEGLSDILDIDRFQAARRVCENFRYVLRGDG
jgi:TatD DNase family protein